MCIRDSPSAVRSPGHLAAVHLVPPGQQLADLPIVVGGFAQGELEQSGAHGMQPLGVPGPVQAALRAIAGRLEGDPGGPLDRQRVAADAHAPFIEYEVLVPDRHRVAEACLLYTSKI